MRNPRKIKQKRPIKWAVLFCVLAGGFAIYLAVFYFYLKRETPAPQFTKVNTLAGKNREFGEPFGVAVKDRDIYVSDGDQGKIWKISGDSVSVFAQGLDTPSSLEFDKSGDLIVADPGSHTIRKVNASGKVSILAGIENKAGFADGEAAKAMFNAPIGIAVGEDGKIYVADTYNDRIRVISGDGRVYTLAGGEKGFADGGAPRLDTPCGLAVWKGGLLIADAGNRRIRLLDLKDNSISTLVGDEYAGVRDGVLSFARLVQPTGITVDKKDSIYFTDGNAVRVIGRNSLPFVETISNERGGFVDGTLQDAQFNRPSGLAMDASGNLLVADSENQVVRVYSEGGAGTEVTADERNKLRYNAEEFRGLAPARWPYDPPSATREIAGTLGELRGEVTDKGEPVRFHNGLDVVGAYGETARFIRDEKVLEPIAAENFGTLRELLRMPTLGYIHISLGRDQTGRTFGDDRFQFQKDAPGKLSGIRVSRGTKFKAGEAIGTLNAMNHVHLVAGRTGAEMNAIDALTLPGVSDSRPPTIENVRFFEENWREIETAGKDARIKLSGKTRIVTRAFDQMDGNNERRRLGIYSAGYQILKDNKPLSDTNWTIRFERMPDTQAARFVYAPGSHSGATGETIFNYIVTNNVTGDVFREDFFDAGKLEQGIYILRVFISDYFGNVSTKDINFEV